LLPGAGVGAESERFGAVAGAATPAGVCAYGATRLTPALALVPDVTPTDSEVEPGGRQDAHPSCASRAPAFAGSGPCEWCFKLLRWKKIAMAPGDRGERRRNPAAGFLRCALEQRTTGERPACLPARLRPASINSVPRLLPAASAQPTKVRVAPLIDETPHQKHQTKRLQAARRLRASRPPPTRAPSTTHGSRGGASDARRISSCANK